MPVVPWTVLADGVAVAVRVTPRGGRDAIEGTERLADGRAVLKVRVRAAPSDGEANAALRRVIADALDVPPSRVDVIAGPAARIKKIKIVGDAVRLTAALERLSGAGASNEHSRRAGARPTP